MLRENEEELVHEIRNSTLILHRLCTSFIKNTHKYLEKIERATSSISADDGD